MPLANPKPIESFFQVNLVEGYGYLDTRGALVRQFERAFQSWSELSENGSTLHFSDPTDPDFPVQELKIGYQLIWLHYPPRATNSAIRSETSRIIEQACAVMEVARFSRQGFRTYQLFPTETINDAVQLLRPLLPRTERWAKMGEIIGLTWAGQIDTGRLKARIELSSVQRTRIMISSQGVRRELDPDDNEAFKFGVMLDADAYDDRLSESRDIKPHMNHAFAFLDDKAVPFLIGLLEGQ